MSPPQGSKPKLVVNYRERTAQSYFEVLGAETQLEMVQIPPGRFIMGSPEKELRRSEEEGPQHEVTLEYSFFMGKYPVTQAQWQEVAGLPQVNRKLDPEPSHFKGNNRPVEQVTWYDAEEFCARLLQATGRPYRLPSEAEWEYACRAGTTTPFHFGETITTDLANYRGTDWQVGESTYQGSYGDGPDGVYRKETTDVGSFDVANAFGLYDMHGNVWEWCADHWHGSYEKAPSNGTIWSSSDEQALRVLRGGSWYDCPGDCRSAARNWVRPDYWYTYRGLRVVCAAART